MLTNDLATLLRGTLPAGVPVLTPEQIDTPRTYAPLAPDGLPQAGGARGLIAYLADHPQGYVQVESPQPISNDGTTAVFWVPVACVAPDAAACESLARAVRLTLNGPPEEPGPCQEVLPDQPRPVSDGVFLCRPTYEALTIGGSSAA